MIFSRPHVTEVLVCDSRKNALLKAGNKNDRVDARKLAELLHLNKLNRFITAKTTTTRVARRAFCRWREIGGFLSASP
jgi:hypothetical protein